MTTATRRRYNPNRNLHAKPVAQPVAKVELGEPRDRCPRCTHINAWHAAGWCGVCGDGCEEGTR